MFLSETQETLASIIPQNALKWPDSAIILFINRPYLVHVFSHNFSFALGVNTTLDIVAHIRIERNII